jgi:hypothetical protein
MRPPQSEATIPGPVEMIGKAMVKDNSWLAAETIKYKFISNKKNIKRRKQARAYQQTKKLVRKTKASQRPRRAG